MKAILIAYTKIESYDLDYRDKQGNPKPAKFVSYIWKRIDGFIIDFLKKEINEPNRIKHQLLQETANTLKLKMLCKSGAGG